MATYWYINLLSGQWSLSFLFLLIRSEYTLQLQRSPLPTLLSKICDPKSFKSSVKNLWSKIFKIFRQKSVIQIFLIDPVSQLSSSPISQPCPMAGDSCASDCRAMSDCGTPCQIVSDVSSAKLCWSLNVERFQVLVDWYPMSDCVRSWSSKSQDGESFRLLVDSW